MSGITEIALVLHIPLSRGKETGFEGSRSSTAHVSVVVYCACICIDLNFLLRFSLTVTSGAFKALKIEAVNFSQMLTLERRPNPFLKDHLSASPSEDLGNVSKDV